MALSLRQHVQIADRIWSTLGVKTLLPKLEPPAPVRVDAGNRLMEYAMSIRRLLERHDTTGYMIPCLRASDEAEREAWREVPDELVKKVDKDMSKMRKAMRRGGIRVER